jgi:hypothetical protein
MENTVVVKKFGQLFSKVKSSILILAKNGQGRFGRFLHQFIRGEFFKTTVGTNFAPRCQIFP